MKLLIDPLEASGRECVRDLIPTSGAYVATLRGLSVDTRLLEVLPDRLWLELYAYECLERLRELALDEPDTIRVALWPGALVNAADIGPNAWFELESMFPAFSSVQVQLRDANLTASAMRCFLGDLRVDVQEYMSELGAWAHNHGYDVTCAPYRTSSLLLIEGGHLLLEWRPASKSVSPSCWDSPGGHSKQAESSTETLHREVREELGIEVEHTTCIAVLDAEDAASGRRYQHSYFTAERYSGTVSARDGQELRWWDISDLTKHKESERPFHPLLLRVLKDALAAGRI